MASAAPKLAAVPNNKPVALAAAFYALSVMQEAVKEAVPAAKEVTVVLEASGAFRVNIILGSNDDPNEVVFILNRHLVPGYRFAKPTTTRENKTFGRHVVSALIDMKEG